MIDRVARIVLMLALVPLSVAVFIVGIEALDRPPLVDPLRADFILCTALVCGGIWLIWRRHIRWIARRGFGMAGVTGFLAVNFILWQPMWSMSGCADEEFLRGGQSLSLLGIWISAFGLLFWGRLLRRGRPTVDSSGQTRRYRMSPSIVRLVVGFGLIPLLPGCFYITGLACEHFLIMDKPGVYVAAYEVCACLLVGVWLLLWRREVPWDSRKIVATAVLTILLFLSPLGIYGLPTSWDPVNMLLAVLPLLVASLWLAGTAMVWRRPSSVTPLQGTLSDEWVRNAARCPQCDYPLVGLNDVRCPECGWKATVDEYTRRVLAEALEPSLE